MSTANDKSPTSRWLIPITDYWKDPEHFILVIPPKEGTVLYANIKRKQHSATLYDTIQGRILKAEGQSEEHNCDQFESYDVEIGPEKKRGKLKSTDVYSIASLDLGTYTVGGRTLKLGEMKLISKMNDDYCDLIRPIFFYDDSFLYLIEAEGVGDNAFSLQWKDQAHLSLIGFPGGIGVRGETVQDLFQMDWGVPNGAVTLRLEFKNDHPKFNSYEMRAIEGDFEADVEEDVQEDGGEEQTVVCVLNDASMGDCFHLEFDCGDFGSAETQLSQEEENLWKDLTIDGNDGTAINPKYKGKTFELTYHMVNGEVCGDPSASPTETKVERITGFKLK